jgi:hypothetical protein
MTARELFAVIVRSLGLLLLVLGIVALGFRVVDYLLLPPYEHSSGEAALTLCYAFVAATGLIILLATTRIVKMFYGNDGEQR